MIFLDYPGHLVAGLLLISIAVTITVAFRSKQLQDKKRWRWLLGLLQYASIVILLLILWNPSRPQKSEIVSKNSVLVLFDTSQSMSVVEDGRATRLDKAMDIFVKKFHPSDTEGPDYKIYGFDHQCHPLVDFRFPSPGSTVGNRRPTIRNPQWGRQTNLHSAFALLDRYEITETTGSIEAQEPVKKPKVAGAVVFTDGQADDKNVNTYLPIRNKDLQVVLIGIGSKNPQSDVAIREIKIPSRVAIDTAYTVQVVVVGRNLQNHSVTVELLKDSDVIASQQLPHNVFTGNVTTEFVVSADKLGRHILSARAKAVEQEVNLANNTRSTTVQVVEKAGLKVLFYSEVANFDIGKVRQALARDKRIQLEFGLDAIIAPALSKKARMMCGHVKLPADRGGFYKYDVVILGPCEMDKLTHAQIDGLYSFVADRGGGLILVPGRAEYSPAAWRNDKMKVLMPVFFEVGTNAAQPPEPGEIKLTTEGIDSKVISEADLEDYDEPTSPCYRVIDKKAAATTLASIHDTPIVSVHRVGRGRVCLLNTSELFRWYREDLEGGLLQKLMSGLIAYVGRVANIEATVELFAGRPTDQTGKVKFDAYVCDKSFAPVAGATVLLTVGDEVLRMDHVGQGYYAAEIENITDEAIIATVQAETDGRFLGEKTIAVNLPLARNEMDNVELDSKFLQVLAKRVGGKYFDADDVDKSIVKMFETTTCVGSLTRMASVWPRWSLLLALCVLLSINWFVRRAVGLV